MKWQTVDINLHETKGDLSKSPLKSTLYLYIHEFKMQDNIVPLKKTESGGPLTLKINIHVNYKPQI